MGDNAETASAHTESLGLINAVTTLIKAKLALWEAAEVVEDYIGFKVKADDSDGTLGCYCVWLGGEIEDVKAVHALGLIAAFREAKKGESHGSDTD